MNNSYYVNYLYYLNYSFSMQFNIQHDLKILWLASLSIYKPRHYLPTRLAGQAIFYGLFSFISFFGWSFWALL